MSHTTTDSDSVSMNFKRRSASNSMDEGNSRGSSSRGKVTLKKGPWTTAEDELLKEYVNKHGEGNWNAVQKHSGLLRCGKSCRLRWTNHLRPHLKKCAFSDEEENLIIQLHAQMGNKWARMATHLPGRTDNEIKNFWNTRLKRRARSNQPIYPDYIAKPKQEFLPRREQNNRVSGSVIHEFKQISSSHFSYSRLSDMSFESLLCQDLEFQTNGFVTVDNFKQVQDSDSLFPYVDVYSGYVATSLAQFPLSEITYGTFSWDGSGGLAAVPLTSMADYSSSQALPATVKLELPSLQYSETCLGDWPRPSSPSIEAGDGFVDSPQTVSAASDCFSSVNDGLLDSLFRNKKASYSEMDYKVNGPDLGAFGGPISPLAGSVTSVDEFSVGKHSTESKLKSDYGTVNLNAAEEEAELDLFDQRVAMVRYGGNIEEHGGLDFSMMNILDYLEDSNLSQPEGKGAF